LRREKEGAESKRDTKGRGEVWNGRALLSSKI